MEQGNGKLRYAKLFFFAFLFLSAVSLSAYLVLPQRMTHTAEQVADGLPYSMPTLRIKANAPFTDADIEELLGYGEAVTYQRELLYTTRSADENALSDLAALYTVDMANAKGFYTLREGRMPQNANECVVSKARGMFYEIGDTLVLWMGEDPVYSLTVVGVADDADSILNAFVGEGELPLAPALHIYRVSDGDAAVQAEATCYIAVISQTENAKKAADELTLYAKAKEQGQSTAYVPDTKAIELAQSALNDAQIKRLRIENQIASLDVAGAEAEAAYLSASAELEAERQDFISKMERHEAVRANQTHLITRREAADEVFAKKQAELDTLYAQLKEIYAERDSLKWSLSQAETVVKEAEAALEQLKTDGAVEEQPTATLTWEITTPRDSESGDMTYVALLGLGKKLSAPFLAATILCIVLTAACVLFWKDKWGLGESFDEKRKMADTVLFTLYTLLTALLGSAIGGLLLPQWKFASAFPTFDGTLTQPRAVIATIIIATLLLSLMFVLLNIFCVRLLARVRALLLARNASSDAD